MKKNNPKRQQNTSLFEYEIQCAGRLPLSPVDNLTALLFNRLEHRREDTNIILSHYGTQLVNISLQRLRFVVFSLYREFEKKDIKPGSTVLLASISGNNELFIALMFLALSCYGVRVLLPMFMETNELSAWLAECHCAAGIIPRQEINSLAHHAKEKDVLKAICHIAEVSNIPYYDLQKDFNIHSLIFEGYPEINYLQEPLVKETMIHTGMDTEALMITTSGSSGKSKIVVYEQGAFIRSCLSWQQAGFYKKSKLGGRGFTPLFNHTMGIRAFFNALWCGQPVCLIISDWFMEKPETVRYFLMTMQPNHITGGPAIYALLLELMRNFPELKLQLRPHLKTLVSSGAPLNSETIGELESAFGIPVCNAYGTTETQQVLSTILEEPLNTGINKTLGLPLPGVSIGLQRLKTHKNHYKMFIKTPFGCKGYRNENKTIPQTNSGFYDTGDIVRLENKNQMYYVAREGQDFFKDDFGVKIPISALQTYYQKLHAQTQYVEYFPQKNQPGLSGLIFINDTSLPQGVIKDKKIKEHFAGLLAELGIQIYQKSEPFEFWHRHLNRFALINDAPPRTAKGSIIRHKIHSLYEDLIKKLTNPLSADEAIQNVDIHAHLRDAYTRYQNPLIGQMLNALGMDYSYHRAKKDSLFTYIDGRETEIIDFTGGYGSNILGHNNTKIKKALYRFLRNNEVAISDQGSIQKYAGLLAEKLNLITGRITGDAYNVLYGSSGAEAVEIALHHALYEWKTKLKKMQEKQFRLYGRYVPQLVKETWDQNNIVIKKAAVHVITSANAFHGNSSGARALLGNAEKREPFSNLLAIKTLPLDDHQDNWQEDLQLMLDKAKITIKIITPVKGGYNIKETDISTVIAAIFEPIIGEGGIREIKKDVLNHFQNYSFPLIMDEIQCGLGRSGKFLASDGIKADYYILGKSLGGGIEKISAVMIDKNRYQVNFGTHYVSTFANGGLATRTALEVLSIIEKENLPEKIRRSGERFIKKLKDVQTKYPDVIKSISGRGLMIGVEFCSFEDDNTLFLRILQGKKMLGYLFSAYLLKNHKVRILPTLSASNTLRIEPSAYISKREIDHFIEALQDLAAVIQNRQSYQLVLSLMDNDPFTDRRTIMPELGTIPTEIEKPAPAAEQVAFVIHFAYPLDELRMLDSTLQKASDTGLRILLNRIQLLLEMRPFTLFAKNICNNRVHLRTILIPLDSAEMERMNRQNKRSKIVNRIQEAVDMAVAYNARVISLGGYTSIMTHNGKLISQPANSKVITGNTLTAALGLRKLLDHIEGFNDNSKTNVLSIVGASGNIGSIIAETLIEKDSYFRKIFLVGKNRNRLENLTDNLKNKISNSSIEVDICNDLSCLKESNIIISMTNTNDPIILKHHLTSTRPVLISDVSIPSAIAPEVKKMTNVSVIPFSSYVSLPEDPHFTISSCSPPGTVVCCAGEAILCGLQTPDVSLSGNLTLEGIEIISQLAETYNFFEKTGQVKSFKATA